MLSDHKQRKAQGMLRRALLTLVFSSVSSMALAMPGSSNEREACVPDVQKLCTKPAPAGADTESFYLKCLQDHRERLSKQCLAVLLDHGR
jgi:hypothetical protein